MLSVSHQDRAVVVTMEQSTHYDPLSLVEEVLARLAPYSGDVVVALSDISGLPLSQVSRFVQRVGQLNRGRDGAYVLAAELPTARRILATLTHECQVTVTCSVDAALTRLKQRREARGLRPPAVQAGAWATSTSDTG
jgi:hypothetical protein